MNKKIGVILQARTGSKRLPHKMILPFYKNEGVFSILLQRIKKVLTDKVQIIVATTTSENDDIIAEIALSIGVSVYRGSENDVLGRFIGAAEEYEVSKIIRICADNPFLDMFSLVELINVFENKNVDYLAYATSKCIPTIKTHYGFWPEAVNLESLKRVDEMTSEQLYHEHVTNFIYANEALFNIDYINIPEKIEQNNSIRLTLDTIVDFELQKRIYEQIVQDKIEFKIEDIVDLLDHNPALYEIMRQEIINNNK